MNFDILSGQEPWKLYGASVKSEDRSELQEKEGCSCSKARVQLDGRKDRLVHLNIKQNKKTNFRRTYSDASPSFQNIAIKSMQAGSQPSKTSVLLGNRWKPRQVQSEKERCVNVIFSYETLPGS